MAAVQKGSGGESGRQQHWILCHKALPRTFKTHLLLGHQKLDSLPTKEVLNRLSLSGSDTLSLFVMFSKGLSTEDYVAKALTPEV